MSHHHHNHGADASVPAKGSARVPPEKHWEKTVRSMDMPKDPWSPKRACDRPTTYVKTNKVDH